MTPTILIYGATGYTGKLAAMQARDTHLSFEIAGRNGPQVTVLADQLDVPYRIFALDDSATIRASLAGVTAVLNILPSDMLKTLIAAVLAAPFHLAAQAAPPVPECPVIAIPQDNVLIGTPNPHVPQFVLSPASLPEKYTGCGYAWAYDQGESTLYTIALFRKGKVIRGAMVSVVTDELERCSVPMSDDDGIGCGQFSLFWTDIESGRDMIRQTGKPLKVPGSSL
jgi:hypothetical protein